MTDTRYTCDRCSAVTLQAHRVEIRITPALIPEGGETSCDYFCPTCFRHFRNWLGGVVGDGYGNLWCARCDKCGEETIRAIAPGKATCQNVQCVSGLLG